MTDPSTLESPSPAPDARQGSGRWRAAGIHLALSVLIFVVLAALIIGWLFPGGLFSSAGGWEGIRIIAGVDLVLGPLLTLIVFNRAKPRREIVRDLSVIGVIQFAALAAGMLIVYQQRPLTVTWAHDRFKVATASEFARGGADPADLPERRWLSPIIGYIDMPDDVSEREQIVTAHMLSSEPLHLRLDLFAPMPDESASRELLRYNVLDADVDAQCVDVMVVSRFGEFERCYHPETQRFARGKGVTR